MLEYSFDSGILLVENQNQNCLKNQSVQFVLVPLTRGELPQVYARQLRVRLCLVGHQQVPDLLLHRYNITMSLLGFGKGMNVTPASGLPESDLQIP